MIANLIFVRRENFEGVFHKLTTTSHWLSQLKEPARRRRERAGPPGFRGRSYLSRLSHGRSRYGCVVRQPSTKRWIYNSRQPRSVSMRPPHTINVVDKVVQ